MNIIQALRTKLPLRRPVPKHKGSHGDGWLCNEYIKSLLCDGAHVGFFEYSACDVLDERDIMADDWEVKEPETEPVPPCGAW